MTPGKNFTKSGPVGTFRIPVIFGDYETVRIFFYDWWQLKIAGSHQKKQLSSRGKTDQNDLFDFILLVFAFFFH